jgi:hypothetical protein
VVAAALAVAALSLLAPWALAFDPYAWLLWGRDALRLELDTSAGPSWKPLPVLFTAPFALAGGGAQVLWAIVARAGALLALAGAARVAGRLGGPGAAAGAALAMALSSWWAFHGALANSEGLLAAAVLWALAAHLEGHRRLAFALGVAAALLRPEAWPFLALYGAWLWRADPGARRVVAAGAALVPLLWLGPDLIGAGGALGASDAARGTPSRGSARHEAVPALAVLWDAVELLTIPAALAALAAAVTRRGPIRALAAGSLAWVAIVAVMAQAGYAGNPRYLVAAAAVGCVLAGVGAAEALRRAPGAAAPLLLALAVAAFTAGTLRDQAEEVGVRADRRVALDDVVAEAGGRDAIVRCARVRTANEQRTMVAWRLDVPLAGIQSPPEPPAAVLRARSYDGRVVAPEIDRAAFELRARAPGWEVWAACQTRG